MDIGSIITFAAIAVLLSLWSFIVIFLDRKKVLERYGLSKIWGIGLMWRTEKGKGAIEKLSSPKRFWNIAANTGLALFYTGMLLMFLMLLASAYFSATSNLARPVGADEIFVLPGINPYIPLVFGLLGLIVAVVAHELSHGIMARAMDFSVKSLGLIFILIPIGAFMEPDEKEVENGPRPARMRMFAAGPLMNFFLAFLFIGLFSWGFMGSVQADSDPFMITNIYEQSAVHLSLRGTPTALYSINGTAVHNYGDISEIEGIAPGNWTVLDMRIGDTRSNVPIVAGVMIVGVSDDTPAGRADIKKGSIIQRIDDNTIWNLDTFHDIMEDKVNGEVINVTLLEPVMNVDGKGFLLNGTYPPWVNTSGLYPGLKGYPEYTQVSYNITLGDKYDYININSFKGKGYLGVSTTFAGITGVGSEELIGTLNHPASSGGSLRERFGNVIYVIFRLPLDTKLMPLHGPLTEILEVDGVLSFVPEPLFWFLANCCFYIFWINILLGLFNALPMVPLDGGFVFRDTLVIIFGWFSRWFRKGASEETLVKWAKKVSTGASFFVLSLILIAVLAPWLRVIFF
ncbi:MAG: site-2 protease family protein [Candidatus Thermoplasmatota archaeon]|jgi:membrane-associated protease RseP (regulator of RpoE activity)|nr:site-2 protease family protein [Candidatus Thermoplasmatota archaeon]